MARRPGSMPLLERRFAPVGLITTRGLPRRVRDRPGEPARYVRPSLPSAGARWSGVSCGCEVTERMSARGEVVTALDEASLRGASEALVERRRRSHRGSPATCLYKSGARAPLRGATAFLVPRALHLVVPPHRQRVARVRAYEHDGRQRRRGTNRRFLFARPRVPAASRGRGRQHPHHAVERGHDDGSPGPPATCQHAAVRARRRGDRGVACLQAGRLQARASPSIWVEPASTSP